MDYWLRLEGLDSTKLDEEIKKLTQRLYAMSASSPMVSQLQDMLAQAYEAKYEKLSVSRMKENKTPDIIDIGDIESVTYTPNYSAEELLKVVVTQYNR